MLRSFLKKHTSLLAFCFFNSMLLVFITFTWINHSYFLSDDEKLLIKGSSMIKNIFVKASEKPDTTRFLFINIAWEKQFIEVKQEGRVIGRRAITDRQRIARFLQYLNKNPEHKFLILDVWFKDSSDFRTDSLLQAQLNITHDYLIPYHKDDQDDRIKDTAIFCAPGALSDYEKDDFDNNFVKFRLVQGNNFKTTPLVLYEKLHHEEFRQEGFWHLSGKKLALNSFILDMKIWNYDLEEHPVDSQKVKASYLKVHLSELLDLKYPPNTSLPASEYEATNDDLRAMVINHVTKDKIVVLGDFEDSDMHETISGPTSGPLILVNVLLALEEGDNLISWSFVLFLFSGYFLISYKCYTKNDLLDRAIGGLLPRTKWRRYLMRFMSYIIYFIILSLISYFLFNIHLTILLLAVYMELAEVVIRKLRKKKPKDNTSIATSPQIVP